MKLSLTSHNIELTTAQIQQLLGRFEIGVGRQWIFPTTTTGQASDGRVGKLCVSQLQEATLFNQSKLAVHLTFQIPTLTLPSLISVDRDQRVTVGITVANLHVTARPLNFQLQISADGNSILAGQVSTHRGSNNDWDHNTDDRRLENMARHFLYNLDEAGKRLFKNHINTALIT